jgi:hypothetical protein
LLVTRQAHSRTVMDDYYQQHSIARKVHALMLDAHPQSGDHCLSAAFELASAASPRPEGNADRLQLIAAINALDRAIAARAASADTEQMLLKAIAAAQHWVRSSS